METNASVQPVKSREMHSHDVDRSIWNDFSFRGDDRVIATYAKTGTTWMQQIVAQTLPGAEISPWQP